MKSGLFVLSGSPGRTRTSDQVVTGDPMISRGLDYLITLDLTR